VHLDLSGNQIGQDGAESLAGVLAQCSSLADLNLESNRIGPQGAASLAGVLAQCASLAHLDLSYNDICEADAGPGVLHECWGSAERSKTWMSSYSPSAAAFSMSASTCRPSVRMLSQYQLKKLSRSLTNQPSNSARLLFI